MDYILLFYDLTRNFWDQHLDEWLERIQRRCLSYCEIVLVGNKADLRPWKCCSEAEAFANKHRLRHFRISAKTQEECSAPFEYCAERLKGRSFFDQGFIPFRKEWRVFKFRFEKGVLSIGENKYKQWIDKSYPNPVELQDGHVDELIHIGFEYT